MARCGTNCFEQRERNFFIGRVAASFNEQVLPAQLQASTRKNYRSGWRQVMTYGLAHEELHKLLPMSLDTLKSITLEFLVVGVSANSIKNVWSAIEHRHRLAELPFPLAQQRSFQRLFKVVAAIKGTPSRLLFPSVRIMCRVC